MPSGGPLRSVRPCQSYAVLASDPMLGRICECHCELEEAVELRARRYYSRNGLWTIGTMHLHDGSRHRIL